MKKNNMVYMVYGVKIRNSMWNAGMDGYQKSNTASEMIGSSQAYGYTLKEQLERDGYSILYRKMSNENGDMTLKEVFEFKTGTNTKANEKLKPAELQGMLLSFEDVVNFGTTFTAYKGALSFGIRGAFQIGIGANKYEDSEEFDNTMMTCFKADKKEVKGGAEATKSSLGNQILIDKAHILYDATLNPYQYDQYIGSVPEFEGYTEENYKRIKNVSLKCVSNTNTKSKKGCTNEFGIFVEMKDKVRDNIDLNCMSEYIAVDIVDGKVVYNLEQLSDLLNDVKEELKSVEVYYDHRTMELVGEIEKAKYFNIKTRKEIK